MADKDDPPISTEKIMRAYRRILGERAGRIPNVARTDSLRQDLAKAYEQNEKLSDKATMAETPKSDFWSHADKAAFGLCELLALLFGLPFGDDLYHDKPLTSIGGWHWVYLVIAILFAVTGPMWPWIRTRPLIAGTVAGKISGIATDARIWLGVLLLLFLYGEGPDIFRRSVPSASEIATAVADKVKPLLPPAQPAQAQGVGFAEAQRPAPKHPSKNYSSEEKQKLLGLIGNISTLLNDEGLPAAQIARVTGYNAVSPSKGGLDDVIKRAESVRDSLAKIQIKIWQDILQPKNSNYLVDLNYIVENNTKLDQFQRATEQFLSHVTIFGRNLDSFSPDQRNWVTSLIQAGTGQNWGRTAEEFRGWVQQCNTRMDVERDGLK